MFISRCRKWNSKHVRLQQAALPLRQWITFPADFTHQISGPASGGCVSESLTVSCSYICSEADLKCLCADGTRLLTLPDRCPSSVRVDRWWLLAKLPSTGCHTQTQVHFFSVAEILQKHFTALMTYQYIVSLDAFFFLHDLSFQVTLFLKSLRTTSLDSKYSFSGCFL